MEEHLYFSESELFLIVYGLDVGSFATETLLS